MHTAEKPNDFILYVPKSGTFAASSILRGSAIVSDPTRPAEEGLVIVYFEGNAINAANLTEYIDRARSAAGRLRENYPTSSVMQLPLNDLHEIGHFHYPTSRLMITDQDSYREWLTMRRATETKPSEKTEVQPISLARPGAIPISGSSVPEFAARIAASLETKNRNKIRAVPIDEATITSPEGEPMNFRFLFGPVRMIVEFTDDVGSPGQAVASPWSPTALPDSGDGPFVLLNTHERIKLTKEGARSLEEAWRTAEASYQQTKLTFSEICRRNYKVITLLHIHVFSPAMLVEGTIIPPGMLATFNDRGFQTIAAKDLPSLAEIVETKSPLYRTDFDQFFQLDDAEIALLKGPD